MGSKCLVLSCGQNFIGQDAREYLMMHFRNYSNRGDKEHAEAQKLINLGPRTEPGIGEKEMALGVEDIDSFPCPVTACKVRFSGSCP